MFAIRLSAQELVVLPICALLAFSLALLAGLLLFKVRARLRAAARARRADRLKADLCRWRSGSAPTARLASREPEDMDILESLLAKEAAMVSGESRRRVIALIEKAGLVDRALRRLDEAKELHGLLAVLPREAEADARPWVAPIVRLGMSAAPKMRLALRKGSPALRWLAVNVLGLLRDSAASEQLAGALLRDPDSRLREAAAVALGNLANPRHIPWLSAALRDPEAGVRARAVEALGNCPDPPAAAGALTGVLSDPARLVRLNLIKALAKLGADGRRILESRLEARP